MDSNQNSLTSTYEVAGSTCDNPGPTAGDLATCSDNTIFGCADIPFYAPSILTSLSMGGLPAELGGKDGLHHIQFVHHLNGFGDSTSYDVDRGVPVDYTTTASGLPTEPWLPLKP